MIVLHWPHGFTGFAPTRRDADGSLSLGPHLEAIPTDALSLVTGLSLGPVEFLPGSTMDRHTGNQTALWAGFGEVSSDEAVALHPSLDRVVGAEGRVMNLGARRDTPTRFDPPMSWRDARSPAAYEVDPRAAAAATSCGSGLGTLDPSEALRSWEGLWSLVDELSDVMVANLAGGCVDVVTLELGTMSLFTPGPSGDLRMLEVWHQDRADPQLEAMTRRMAVYVAGLVEALRTTDAGDGRPLLDHTLVVLTTSGGGDFPAAHRNQDVPVVLLSQAETFQSGQWVDASGRPMADVLRTVSAAFGAEASFASSEDGTAIIDGLFTP